MPEITAYIDLAFQITCATPLPSDHGYALFSAISGVLPSLHDSNSVAIHPIRGTQVGNRQIQLDDKSRLTLRTAVSDIPKYLLLAGKQLNVLHAKIQVGVPEIRSLYPAETLRSRLVTTKNCLDLSRFEAEIKRQVTVLDSDAIPSFRIGKRRTIRIRDREVVGYEVVIEGLSPSLSLAIQVHGIGGRRHMGCGVFVPVETRQNS